MDLETQSNVAVQPVFLPRGQHLLLTLSGCDPALLDDLPVLEILVRRAALATGAHVVGMQAHRFTPRGVTVLALLAESHMSLHTYPEAGVVFVDCFTCGACDPQASIPIFTELLQPTHVTMKIIDREGGSAFA